MRITNWQSYRMQFDEPLSLQVETAVIARDIKLAQGNQQISWANCQQELPANILPDHISTLVPQCSTSQRRTQEEVEGLEQHFSHASMTLAHYPMSRPVAWQGETYIIEVSKFCRHLPSTAFNHSQSFQLHSQCSLLFWKHLCARYIGIHSRAILPLFCILQDCFLHLYIACAVQWLTGSFLVQEDGVMILERHYSVKNATAADKSPAVLQMYSPKGQLFILSKTSSNIQLNCFSINKMHLNTGSSRKCKAFRGIILQCKSNIRVTFKGQWNTCMHPCGFQMNLQSTVKTILQD